MLAQELRSVAEEAAHSITEYELNEVLEKIKSSAKSGYRTFRYEWQQTMPVDLDHLSKELKALGFDVVKASSFSGKLINSNELFVSW